MSSSPQRRLPHDWFSQPLPTSVELGERTWLYSSYALLHYQSRAAVGLRVGHDTGIYHGAHFELGPDAEVRIGDYCTLIGTIFATNGTVSVGDYAFVAHEVVFADSDWPLPPHNDRAAPADARSAGRCHIEVGENVWIGAQAILIGNVRIGEGAIIGAGTLVTQDVPPLTICAGNPMRVMRTIPRGDVAAPR